MTIRKTQKISLKLSQEMRMKMFLNRRRLSIQKELLDLTIELILRTCCLSPYHLQKDQIILKHYLLSHVINTQGLNKMEEAINLDSMVSESIVNLMAKREFKIAMRIQMVNGMMELMQMDMDQITCKTEKEKSANTELS